MFPLMTTVPQVNLYGDNGPYPVKTPTESLSGVWCDAATKTAGYVKYKTGEAYENLKNLDCATTGDKVTVVSVPCVLGTEVSQRRRGIVHSRSDPFDDDLPRLWRTH